MQGTVLTPMVSERQRGHTLSLPRKSGKLKTHSGTYCLTVYADVAYLFTVYADVPLSFVVSLLHHDDVI